MLPVSFQRSCQYAPIVTVVADLMITEPIVASFTVGNVHKLQALRKGL